MAKGLCVYGTVEGTWNGDAVLAHVQQVMLARANKAVDALEAQARENMRTPDRRGDADKTARREDDSNTVGIRTSGLEAGGRQSIRHGGTASPGLLVVRPYIAADGNIKAGVGFAPHDKIAAILELGLAGTRPFRYLTNARAQAWSIMQQAMGIH